MITRTSTAWDTGAAVATTESLFAGATLALHYNSTRVMSDVWETLPYATVFNAATGKVEIVWHDGKSGTVDATAEVIDAANAWLLSAVTAARKAVWDARVASAVSAAHKVEKGKTVVVVKGRKVAKGTTGEVFWVGAGKAYSWADAKFGVANRIGIKDAAGATHWTAASNVEVVNADDYFDYDAWVTDEPDHAAAALATLNNGKGYAEVILSAGDDRLGFGTWFKAAALAAAA